MNKIVGIAMLTFLSCLPMSIITIENVQSQTTQDSKTEATRLLRQGNQLYQASRYREAIQTWQLALGIYRTIKDRKGEATILNNLGTTYESFGQYRKAIDFYSKKRAS